MEEILKGLEHQPVDLTQDELENPEKVISIFFDTHSLQQSRANLWKLYKGWIYDSSEYADKEETKKMMFFYTQLVEFINASYIYIEKKKRKV